MKRIMVLGATGQIGRHVTEQLLENGFVVYPASRKAETDFKKTNTLVPINIDVTDSLDDLAGKIKDVDAIIDTIGNNSNYLEVEVYGQIKVMKAAKKNGIQRFIKISWIGVEDLESPISKHYFEIGYGNDIISIHLADEWLATQSKLDWTVVRPVTFTSEKGTNKIKISKNSMDIYPGTIPQQDVAKVLVDCLFIPETINKGFSISSGHVEIETALKSI